MNESTISNTIKCANNSTTELSNPDTRLIDACEAFCAAEAAYRSFFSDGATPIDDDDARHAAQRPYRELQEALMEIIGDDDRRATTLEGMRARARAAVAWAEGDGMSLEGESHEIVACLLNDLLGSGAYQPSRHELSPDLLASEAWLRAIGKPAPVHLADAN